MGIAAHHFLSSRAPKSAAEFLARYRYLAVDEKLSWEFHTGVAPSKMRAPAADVDRWIEATRTLVLRVREISNERDAARHRRYSRFAPIWRRALWMIRNPGGRAKVEEAYWAVCDRLDGELALAYQAYDEQAAGLTEFVKAELDRKELAAQREREAWQRRQLREREERAAALGGPEDAVWACSVTESSQGRRRIEIWLPALDGDPVGLDERPSLTNATAREVQAEMARERAAHPHTPVHWGINTARAMRERHGDRAYAEVETWEELTGERIEVHPGRSRDGRGSGHTATHGPSSTYGSDPGGSGHGGGDYGGGGFAGGGFGGSY